MTSGSELVGRIQSFSESLQEITDDAGGILRCETCGARTRPLAEYWRKGWPRCCGYTMRWWTQKQIDAGEGPGGVA